jgi:hypothetical protein
MAYCPHCATPLNRHAHVGEEPSEPNDGDIAICFRCGGISIFVADRYGAYLREPTPDETRQIQTHPTVIAALKARAQHLNSLKNARQAALDQLETDDQ